MKPKTLVVLMAALAACVIFIVLRHSVQTLVGEKKGAPAAGVCLFETAPAGAAELTVVSAQGTRLAFAKSKEVWRMVEPVAAKADRAKVQELADAMIRPQGAAVAASELPGEAVTGLGEPPWTMTLVDERGRRYVLAVGRAAAMSGGARTYVRDADSGRVFVVAMDFADRLSQPANEFRDKGVWEWSPGDVRRVAIAGRESYELVGQEGVWQVVAPRVRAAADAERVRELLDRLASLKVRGFVTDAPQRLAIYGLDNPRLTVTVELAAEPTATGPAAATESAPASQAARSHTVALGAEAEGKVYARLLEGAGVFELPAAMLDDLQPTLGEMRDRRVLALDEQAAQSVEGIELDSPDGRIVLVNQDGQWQMEAPFVGPANWAAASVLIDRLRSMEGQDFSDAADAAAFGLASPRGTITLHVAGRDQPARLLVGGRSGSGEMTFVKSADQATVATVRTAEVEGLLAGPAAYWDTTLLKIPAGGQATELEIRRDGEQTVLTADATGKWSMVKPVAAPAETVAVEAAVAALRDVTAQQIVALGKDVPKEYAKAPGMVTVTLTAIAPLAGPQAKAETSAHTLHMVTLEGSVYAWVDGAEPAAVGRVDSGLLEKLGAEFRSCEVGMPAEGEVEVVKITRAGVECGLQRLLGLWRYQGDAHVRVTAAKVEAFCQNVRGLKAQRFAAYRAGAEKQKEFGLRKPDLTVEVTTAAGQTYRVGVAAGGPEGSTSRYAYCTAVDGVFLLSPQAVAGLSKGLEDFKE